MTLHGNELLAFAVVAVTLLAVLTRPRNLSEGAAAIAGATVMLALGYVSVADVGVVVRDNFTVLGFFLGMMVLTTLAEEAQVFERMASYAAQLAKGSPRRLFLNVFVLGTLISTFLTNDATALILTPVVFTLVTRLQLDPLPYVFACTFIADTASMTLQISNPINIVLAQRFPGLTLVDFLHYLLLPSLAAILLNVLGFTLLFRKKLGGTFAVDQPLNAAGGAADQRAFRIAVLILSFTAVAFLIATEMRPAPIGFVALAGGSALIVATRFQHRLQWSTLVKGVSWSIFPFIVGMFVMVRGLERLGAMKQLGTVLATFVGQGTFRPVVVTTFFSALSSNLLNNVPAVAVMSATIPTIHHVSQPALVYATLIGCDLGPNLTVVGSLSTMIWLLLLRQRKLDISALDYARLGIIVTPLMLLSAALVLVALLG